MVLIEPVCNEQLPGFYLRTIDQAGQVLTDVNHPNLKIMFDCYHIFHESGELEANFAAFAKQIGHVQIAAAEDRAEPFCGIIDYKNLLPQFKKWAILVPLDANIVHVAKQTLVCLGAVSSDTSRF